MKFYDQLKSTLERYLLRSTFYQLLAVAALIGLISISAGVLAFRTVHQSSSLGESIWWAFLRLTDPGYLGDDEGLLQRSISMVLTVLGYVLFMGSLVAIMTTWLNTNMRRLESGYTAIRRNNHILVLGWTSRAAIVVGDLLHSEGMIRRFLRVHGSRNLHVVILAEEVTPLLMQEIKARAGKHWDPDQITLRSGSPLRAEHLQRVDYLNASAILLPAGEFTDAGPENIDTHTIKALLSLSNRPKGAESKKLPLVVAEILDERKAEIARSAYAGPIEVLASDTAISRLVAQNVRHRGLSAVYSELLTHRLGNEIFLRTFPELAGRSVGQIYDAFPKALLLGVLRATEDGYLAQLNCPGDYVLGPEDRCVLVARQHEETEPSPIGEKSPPSQLDFRTARPDSTRKRTRRVLMLGWSHKVPRLISELLNRGDRIEITGVSSVGAAQRQASIVRYSGAFDSERITLVDADYTNERELAPIRPESFDNVILLGSDWLDSREESDARTIVGYLVLKRVLDAGQKRPDIIVELLDSENAELLGQRPGDVLISPVMLSHMLAQVALRRELIEVFEQLFAVGGAEITFRPWTDFGLPAGELRFYDIMRAAFVRGETALGLVHIDEQGHRTISLNPPRERLLHASRVQEIVVVANEVASRSSSFDGEFSRDVAQLGEN